jgi:hypothetical protein
VDAGGHAWHKGVMEGDPAPLGSGRESQAQQRRTQLGERIRELHARNEEITTSLVRARQACQPQPGSSSPAQVKRAEEFAMLAAQRAAEATRRAAGMHLHAAEAHDRAAELHEQLAAARTGDNAHHQARAVQHRRQAAQDRGEAATITSGLPEAER